MPRPRKAGLVRSRYKGPLDLDDVFALHAGGNGYSGKCSFQNDDDRREAWENHRERILRDYGHPGKRPAAWWQFDSPEPRDDSVYQCVQLLKLGVITDAEMSDLQHQWDFHEGQGFSIADSIKGLDLEAYHRHCDQYQIPADSRRFPL